MVCLGNICRSPLAEGIMNAQLKNSGKTYHIDSAGTGAWHEGEPPDRRSIDVAAGHGLDISSQRARKVVIEDFEHFDYIFAMDRSVLTTLVERSSPEYHHKIHLMLKFAGMGEAEVPDPWFGDPGDFEHVYHLLTEACTRSASRLLNEGQSTT